MSDRESPNYLAIIVKKIIIFRLLIAAVVLYSLSCSSSKSRNEELLAKYSNDVSITSERASVAIPSALPPIAPDMLAPGLLLKISSSADEKLNGKFRVGADGALELPYGVKQQAAGLTVGQLKETLSARYRPFYRSAPAIGVEIDEREYYVRVDGLVTTPGDYLVKGDATIDTLINKAGGLQKSGDQTPFAQYLRVEQRGASSTLRLSDYYSGVQPYLPVWQGGEKVFFQSQAPEAGAAVLGGQPRLQILGQVQKPGDYYVRDQSDFFYYLGQAGGPTDRADLERIALIRKSGGVDERVEFSLEDVSKIPRVKAGDVILVYADTRSGFEKDTSTFGTIGGFFTSLAMAVVVAVSVL